MSRHGFPDLEKDLELSLIYIHISKGQREYLNLVNPF